MLRLVGRNTPAEIQQLENLDCPHLSRRRRSRRKGATQKPTYSGHILPKEEELGVTPELENGLNSITLLSHKEAPKLLCDRRKDSARGLMVRSSTKSTEARDPSSEEVPHRAEIKH